ncbi:MAG: DUF861 domain-containing protein [Desulfovibrionaceae bacterium]|nr:DUF861 domain-containing protein [Desulfovibrionaceae bacterium]
MGVFGWPVRICEPVVFGAGDFVSFPKGMTCRRLVKKAVRKHHDFF